MCNFLISLGNLHVRIIQHYDVKHLTGSGAANDELNWSLPAMLTVPGNCKGSGVTDRLITVAGSLLSQFCH